MDECSQGETWSPVGAACGSSATSLNWEDALKAAVTANTANVLGYNDWRLPSIKELQSLVDRSKNNPAIDSSVFPNTSYWWYWSSTTGASIPSVAWGVNFGNGYAYAGSTSFILSHVRLVRGGQSFDLLIPATAALAQTGATATTATFSATLAQYPDNVNATGCWLVRLASDPAPTPGELKSGTSGGTTGSGATASGQTQTFIATGLAAGTRYTLYYATEDANGNMNLIRSLAFAAGPMVAAPVARGRHIRR